MMLSWTGPTVRVPIIELPVQIGEGRHAPWGWCASAPYRGSVNVLKNIK